jgi:hypothetical protein
LGAEERRMGDMNIGARYITIAVLTLIAIAILLSRRLLRKEPMGLSPLAGLAFGFVLAGVVFYEQRLLGFGLMGIGIVLSIIDIFNHRRHDRPKDSSEPLS